MGPRRRKTEKGKEENIRIGKISFVEEKKTEKEKEKHILGRKKKSYFREEKTGKEREENIWRRRIFFWKRRKRSKIFGEGIFSFWRI